MGLSKTALCREFCLGLGMTLFLCAAPMQNIGFFTVTLFIGMFTFYETFPEFHWCPAITLWKIVSKEEDLTQGVVRILVQFASATLAAILGYKTLDGSAASATEVVMPNFVHEEDWRNVVWAALIWAAWIGLINHEGKKEEGTLRRNLALTFTFCSANYVLQGIAADCILNSAVNVGRSIGARMYIDEQAWTSDNPNLKKLWLHFVGPVLGVALAWVFLWIDAKVAAMEAPNADGEETTALYGSTENQDAGNQNLELSAGDKKDEA